VGDRHLKIYGSRDNLCHASSGLESGDGAAFFAHLTGDVDWTVEGTHPLASTFE
jgi:hypothetical protein